MTPGVQTTEHKRAVRAEVLGAVLVAAGFTFCWLGVAQVGLPFVMAGAVLYGLVAALYAYLRTKAKMLETKAQSDKEIATIQHSPQSRIV